MIKNCLRSILDMNSALLMPSIVVVDNGSEDETVAIIEDVFENSRDINTKLITKPMTIPMKTDANTLMLLTLIEDLSSIDCFMFLIIPVFLYKYLQLCKKCLKMYHSFDICAFSPYLCTWNNIY